MWEHEFSLFHTFIFGTFCIFLGILGPFFRFWPLCNLETRLPPSRYSGALLYSYRPWGLFMIRHQDTSPFGRNNFRRRWKRLKNGVYSSSRVGETALWAQPGLAPPQPLIYYYYSSEAWKGLGQAPSSPFKRWPLPKIVEFFLLFWPGKKLWFHKAGGAEFDMFPTRYRHAVFFPRWGEYSKFFQHVLGF